MLIVPCLLTLESIYKPKNIIRLGIRGGPIGPLPSTFDIIHPIELIIGTYKEHFCTFN